MYILIIYISPNHLALLTKQKKKSKKRNTDVNKKYKTFIPQLHIHTNIICKLQGQPAALAQKYATKYVLESSLGTVK